MEMFLLKVQILYVDLRFSVLTTLKKACHKRVKIIFTFARKKKAMRDF